MTPFLLEHNLRRREYTHKEIDKDFKHAILSKYGTNYHLKTKKKIIIFSTQLDTEMDEMGVYFLSRNIDYDRINSEEIAQGYFSFSINYTQEAPTVVLQDKRSKINYDLDNYDYIWFRHFSVNCTNNTVSSYENEYREQEWMSLFSSIPMLYKNKVFMPSYSDGFLTKPYQLKLARKVGLKIIPTLISNNYEEIDTFTQRNSENIVKAIYHHMFFTDRNNLVEFNTKNFIHLDSKEQENVSQVPAIYQPNYFNSTSKEVRVTVFGEKMIAYYYQNYFGKDWHPNLQKLRVKKIIIPSDIENNIINFFKLANISFGTVDFIIQDKTWYFLEVNVNGDWAWLENLADTSFSDLLIETLLER